MVGILKELVNVIVDFILLAVKLDVCSTRASRDISRQCEFWWDILAGKPKNRGKP
jgi:hypothetical protein